MNINIYYGGRGLVDDPTIFVINRIQQVLEELNVRVNRYNLYELKNTITTLSQTVNEADGVILATTVEWFGMGGYMQTFLDSCWLYSDKSQIADLYMFPVVMSRTYGEKEVAMAFSNAWEILGGRNAQALTAYVDETSDLEFNKEYTDIIEKYAENIYRTISKKVKMLPSSSISIRRAMVRDTINLTPQENEQLSKYASDDDFVKTQKQDIESLASIYKELLSDQECGGDDYYLDTFKNNYVSHPDYSSSYMLMISDKDKNIDIRINKGELSVQFGENPRAEVIAKLSKETFNQIAEGRITFHRAFMTGDMTAKGNFKTLRMLDELFHF
ncbi:MAG: SCP2 sterol-binding domain-containing protein [Eubacteriales bacterium]|nr:SCP2 sterol-binding domain-containing protein [Eubacteriales bacterium]